MAEAIDAITVEELVESLELVTSERDEYLDMLKRLQADFDNYRKRMMSDSAERISAGVGRLAEALLPVLDACDAAVGQGHDEVAAVQQQLMNVLAGHGLERIVAEGATFDPAEHEAVLHEAADEAGESGPVVADELRAGYRWSGKVLRPAMVKVRG